MTSSTQDWISGLALEDRVGTPDLLLKGDPVPASAHAGAIEACFERLGVSAVLLIGSVPTIGFLEGSNLDQDRITEVHRSLWNQGLMSLLVVTLPAELRIYTLWEPPSAVGQAPQNLNRLIIETLRFGADAAKLRTLVAEIECGRYFEEHQGFFRENARVDWTLIANLEETVRQLCKHDLDSGAARAVLLQVIFISYLEDRRIIDRAYYQQHVRAKGADSLSDILKLRSFTALSALFKRLRRDFNGDIFYGPCSFGPSQGPRLSTDQLAILDDFRSGSIELVTGQLRFWPFDFSYVPVELISSIYDRFLNEQDSDRRTFGSYFTPTFLADITVDQAWEAVHQKRPYGPSLRVLDPACGSGIFLVRIFQRMISAWRARHANAVPPWRTLKSLLNGLHGIDKQADAVRISVFSLYIALLEEIEPPAIVELLRKGRILPRLFGKSLIAGDFFNSKFQTGQYDLVVGNPPWISRNSRAAESALTWCEKQQLPMPQKEVAWAFVWKAQQHTKQSGVVALLLPAMGVLHNHTAASQQARRKWLETARLLRVINFSDVCFQLFDDADRPTVLAVFTPGSGETHEFEYWCPKATRILSAAKILVVAASDRWSVQSRTAIREPFFWKRRMWASGRELRMLDWLLEFPKLGRLLSTYRTQRDPKKRQRDSWIIGQGFQELHGDRLKGKAHGSTSVAILTQIPFLDTSSFRPWAIPSPPSRPWPTQRVRRAGFVDGYFGPRILIAQGVQRATGLLRAAYVEKDFSFRHSIQAIKFPNDEIPRAKLLTAILNSNLAAWFMFHTTANLGTERAKVHMEELLELPFPDADDLPVGASRIAEQIVTQMDGLLRQTTHLFSPQPAPEIDRINGLVYQYFGLTNDEAKIVEESANKVIPSMQPRRGAITPLLREASEADEIEYARLLVGTLETWANPGSRLRATLLGETAPWRAIQLRFSSKENGDSVEVSRDSEELMEAIHHFMSSLPAGQSRNFYQTSNLKVFVNDTMTMVKPSDTRFWTLTAALNDADEIGGDLLIERHNQAMSNSHA